MTRVALDSNILIYAAAVTLGAADDGKVEAARDVIARLRDRVPLVVPAQACGETYTVLVRTGVERSTARTIVARIMANLSLALADARTVGAALDLASSHKLQYWDALILATAADAGCALLLSEDMQDGFVWRGVTIVNPLAAVPHPLLADLLAGE